MEIAHRDYYLEQKRRLATRPEYKAHRRAVYKQRTDELKLLGILPRKRGRPQMYVVPEAFEMLSIRKGFSPASAASSNQKWWWLLPEDPYFSRVCLQDDMS